MLTAVTLDYWDTIYAGTSDPARVGQRQDALREMLERVGADVPAHEFERLYRASAVEADRWWRDEHRGYTTADRIRWFLAQLAIERPQECEHIARAVQVVDDSLVAIAPPLLPGAAHAIRALSGRFKLAIVSDTGFASGKAQDRLLEKDGLLDAFDATIYSMDIGHAKPRPEPFDAAVLALGVLREETLHVGDNERTDVGGALAAGLRAVRLDVVKKSGLTVAEHVATSLDGLVRYMLAL